MLSFEIASYRLGTLAIRGRTFVEVLQVSENSTMLAFPKSYTEWAVKSYRSACCPAPEFQGRQASASASSSEREPRRILERGYPTFQT